MIGRNGNKGNTKQDNVKNNIISKMVWKVELLFVLPVMEMKEYITTTSSSFSITNNYHPTIITLNSINEDVTFNGMLSSVFRYKRKVII